MKNPWIPFCPSKLWDKSCWSPFSLGQLHDTDGETCALFKPRLFLIRKFSVSIEGQSHTASRSKTGWCKGVSWSILTLSADGLLTYEIVKRPGAHGQASRMRSSNNVCIRLASNDVIPNWLEPEPIFKVQNLNDFTTSYNWARPKSRLRHLRQNLILLSSSVINMG